jgi:hypothetical protein
MDGFMMQERPTNVRNYVISVAILVAVFLSVVLYRRWDSSRTAMRNTKLTAEQIARTSDTPPADTFWKPVSISLDLPPQGQKVNVVNGKFTLSGDFRISNSGDRPLKVIASVEITKKGDRSKAIHNLKSRQIEQFDEDGKGRFEIDYKNFDLSGDYVLTPKLMRVGVAGKWSDATTTILESKPVNVKFVQVK